MSLRLIDATSDDEFFAWFDAFARCEHDSSPPLAEGWRPEEVRASSVPPVGERFQELLEYRVDGVIVAVASLWLRRGPNAHIGRADLQVSPDQRRRGYGGAALVELENHARARGVTELMIMARERADNLRSGPSRTFAPTHGYELNDEDVRRELDWPRPTGELDRLEAQWRPFAKDYDLMTWAGPTPEPWRAERARLKGTMSAESPTGEVQFVVEPMADAQLVEFEGSVERMGRELLVTAARHRASNELGGYSELTVSRASPDNAYQWDTLVAPTHRGHRLGGLLKVANLRQLERTKLAVRRISTSNAAANAPMIRVNEELGAYVSGGGANWRKTLR
jgi:GNAT superfamily N-acetyltransferase